MVSEGDLIRRGEPERQQRRDWWLEMLAEGETLSEDYVRQLGGREATARDLMSALPLLMVEEGTDSTEIAALLIAHRIKRVPVVRDGRLVGIVSRADLLRAIAPAVRQSGSGSSPRDLIDHHIADEWQRPLRRAREAAERRARPYLFVATRRAASLDQCSLPAPQTMVAGVEKVLEYMVAAIIDTMHAEASAAQADADVVGCPGRRLHDGGRFQSAERYVAPRLAGQGLAVRKPTSMPPLCRRP
jgi:hypothetical protein